MTLLLLMDFSAQGKEREGREKIIYDLNGGFNSILNPEYVGNSQLPFVLKNPKREGYSFGGWYLEEDNRRIYKITEKKKYHLYAKWILNINANQNVQDYPYPGKDRHLLLKDLRYDFLDEIKTPGNPRTRVEDLLEDKYSSEYQCPQGLCLTKEYFIVSSYAMENWKLGALTFYDRRTGEAVISFGLQEDSHLGGVTFDGEYLYICHSNTKEIECISYDFLCKVAEESKQSFVDISQCFQKYKVENIPSCITSNHQFIYIATHRIYGPGVLYCYQLKDNCMQLKEKFLIPSKVQGIYIDEEGRVFMSQSYGRNATSNLLVFSNKKFKNKELLKPSVVIEMPPGAEAIAVEKEVCYVLFETASYKYLEGSDGKGNCNYPIDKILRLDCNSIFFE